MGSFQSSQPLSQSQLPPACSSPAAAAAPPSTATASPQWMVLAPYGGGDGKACNDITGDPKTVAVAAISDGRRISVSLRREPSSSLARICLCFLPGAGEDTTWACSTSRVVAAHGGSVLLLITSSERNSSRYLPDLFIYSNVVAAATANPARPPSLYPLPGRLRDVSATGFLWRSEAEFVVAELTIAGSEEDVAAAAAAPRLIAFELRLFRHGKWFAKRPSIVGHCSYGYGDHQIRARWETTVVLPLSNGMLCWVDRHSGVIFSDVLEEGPNKLRYVPYPEESTAHRRERFVCTDVRGALKLVSVVPQRCTHCGCGEHDTAFVIWTLKTDDMAWVLETATNMVDATELWMLPDSPGYARAHLIYPPVNMKGGGHVVASVDGGGDHVSDERSASVEEEDENMSLTCCTSSATSMQEEDEKINSGEDAVSDESSVPIEEEDEHMSLSVAVSTRSSPAKVSLDDGLQGGNGATSSASNGDQQQGDNGPATVGSWPKRRRRANSMVSGPDWIVY